MPLITPETRRQLARTSANARPFSLKYIYGVAVVAAVLMFAVCVIVELTLYPTPVRHVMSTIVAALTFVLVLVLMYHATRRRKAVLQRMLVVAEMNHHIRNALQTMEYEAYIHGYQGIKQAVDRIETALTEILPLIIDKKESGDWVDKLIKSMKSDTSE